MKSALSQYTNWDFISLVSKYGVDFEERDHGQLFCLDSAKDIVNVLLKECDQPNITQRYRADIHNIQKTDSGFSFQIDTDEITCASLVIATGGLSMPKLGRRPLVIKLPSNLG